MSNDARPISPTRFREAIQELPVGNLHAKAAELRNSIDHLKRSNNDLAEFADDPDCKDAVAENLGVIRRMEDRILMLRQEVERRGMPWVEDDGYKEGLAEPGEDVGVSLNGTGAAQTVNGTAAAQRAQGAESAAASTRGRLTDEQLRQLLAERMGEADNDEEEGLHL